MNKKTFLRRIFVSASPSHLTKTPVWLTAQLDLKVLLKSLIQKNRFFSVGFWWFSLNFSWHIASMEHALILQTPSKVVFDEKGRFWRIVFSTSRSRAYKTALKTWLWRTIQQSALLSAYFRWIYFFSVEFEDFLGILLDISLECNKF